MTPGKNKNLRIIFFGLPGAGKTTQSRLLSREFNIPNFSSGSIIKQEIKVQTDFGKRILKFVEIGQIGPETEIAKIILSTIRPYHSFILDGFPRTLKQLQLLLLKHDNITGILIEIPLKIVFSRVRNRLECINCGEIYSKLDYNDKSKLCNLCECYLKNRFDNTKKAIIGAIKTFNIQTLPAIKYLKKRNRLVRINTEGLDKIETFEKIKLELATRFSLIAFKRKS